MSASDQRHHVAHWTAVRKALERHMASSIPPAPPIGAPFHLVPVLWETMGRSACRHLWKTLEVAWWSEALILGKPVGLKPSARREVGLEPGLGASPDQGRTKEPHARDMAHRATRTLIAPGGLARFFGLFIHGAPWEGGPSGLPKLRPRDHFISKKCRISRDPTIRK